jgi:hypothetical protein
MISYFRRASHLLAPAETKLSMSIDTRPYRAGCACSKQAIVEGVGGLGLHKTPCPSKQIAPERVSWYSVRPR